MQKGGSQDLRDTRKDGSGQERYEMGEILDRRDKGQDSWEVGQVGCRKGGFTKGGMQERSNVRKKGCR